MRIIILFLISGLLSAQAIDVKFTRLTSREGLSNNSVNAVLRDSRGFLWIGTENGLNRYDGQRIKVFKPVNKDSSSISDVFIVSLAEDRNGNILIGTNAGGLSIYNPQKSNFTTLTKNSNGKLKLNDNDVRSISLDKTGRIWIGTSNGINIWDKSLDSVIVYYPNIPLWKIIQDKFGNMWCATYGRGLLKYDIKLKSFHNYTHIPSQKNSISSDYLRTVFEDDDGLIWIGSDKGLDSFDPHNEVFTNISLKEAENSIISENSITEICSDAKGGYFASSENGLYHYTPKNELLKVFRYDVTKPDGLPPGNLLHTVYKDNQNLLWVGTAAGGLCKMNLKLGLFGLIRKEKNESETIAGNLIRAVFEESDGIVWTGSFGEGLTRIDLKNKEFKYFLTKPKNAKRSIQSDPSAILIDSRNRLWVGSWTTGVYLFEDVSKLADKKIVYPEFSNFQIHTNGIIQDIFEDSKGRIWFGTALGLSVFNEDTKKFNNYPANQKDIHSLGDNRIQSNSIAEDRFGNFWVGTWNGLYKVTFEETEDFYHPRIKKVTTLLKESNYKRTITDNRIISVCLDSEENLWLGTYSSGIDLIPSEHIKNNHENFSCQNFSDIDGLCNNTVFAIEEDGFGNLWISTNDGLSRFNKKSKEFNNYFSTHGLQDNQFYWGASAAGKTNLYFGGVNGLNYFNPKSFIDDGLSYNPPIVFTGFRKFGKTFETKVPFDQIKELELSYKDNYFTVEFAALDLTEPEKIQYSYKLEGFDKDWINNGNLNFASYTNLSGGKYTLLVKTSGSNRIYSATPAKLSINIVPPFWETAFFRILVIALFILAVFGFIRMRTRRIFKQKEHLEKQVISRTAELMQEISIRKEIEQQLKESNESKDKLFSIIAHDLRSPFTGIISISSMMRDEFETFTKIEIAQYLDSLNKSAKSIYSLLENLLNYSRIQLGVMHLDPTVLFPAKIAEEVCELLNSTASAKEITLLNSIDFSIRINADKNMLYTVLRNLVSNSIKFSNEGGIITLSAESTTSGVIISVADNGIGMDEKKIQSLFKIKENKSSYGTKGEKGTGLGLVLCKELIEKSDGNISVTSIINEGTNFKITLPKNMLS